MMTAPQSLLEAPCCTPARVLCKPVPQSKNGLLKESLGYDFTAYKIAGVTGGPVALPQSGSCSSPHACECGRNCQYGYGRSQKPSCL